MRRFTQTLPVLLAIALQLMPLVRNLCLNPAVSSQIAFCLRLGLGTAAAFGAFDAVSRASDVVTYSSSPYYSGTVGAYFTNNISIIGNQNGMGDYFTLNNATIFAGPLTDGMSTTSCLPNGLKLTVYNPNDGISPAQPIYCAIYGIPTTAVSSLGVNVNNGYPGETPINEQIFFTITGQSPTITNQPVGQTNVAGGNATFTVKAGGAPAPAYQWRFAAAAVAGATNATLTLTNIRASQAGNYVVVITNTGGSVTSSIAVLGVTNPLPPRLTAPAKNGGQYQFTFIPVTGLTNTVLTNRTLLGGSWGVFTNIPPPTTTSLITISDSLTNSSRFYRLQVVP